ncbi:MAG: dienelactone hydrolase family protein [Deltaproteobacteria bacterium]|nr:dienelactone hydrolase family protein [Deltaproteobacteria bacterium]MBW2666012.1 dienelactone hydrolase family protein [Deltaproteobacteria bacterium]
MGAERAGNEIEIANGDEALSAYLAMPASGRGPGVLVIQEWWGLVPHIRDVCDRLAREGFVALAPDLYHGSATDDPDEAGRYMLGLEIPRALRDLDAAVGELLNRDTVGAKVGVVGFCMGGQLALAAGCKNARVGAVVDFYGVHPDVTLDLADCRAAVLAVFAENDAFITAETVQRLSAEFEAAGVRASVRTIEAAQHAFMNDTRPDVYDAAAAAEGWAALLGLFRAELG